MSHSSPAPHILESTTQKVLHAQGFSRSSSNAALVLSDLLARYLVLLLGAAGRHAEHAGRTHMAAKDAVAALADMGVGVDELAEYLKVEGVEMVRYTGVSQRRAEEIREWGVQLADGLPPKEEGVPLVWAPVDEDMLERMEMEGDEDEEDVSIEDDMDAEAADDPLPSLLSLYPFRSTTPDHLPPIPTLSPDGVPISDEPITADGITTTDSMVMTIDITTPAPISVLIPSHTQAPSRGTSTSPSRAPRPLAPPHDAHSPHRDPAAPSPIKREPSPPAQQLPALAAASTSSGADYAAQIPYAQSVLAAAPEWHLPHPPPPLPAQHKLPRRPTAAALLPPPTPGGGGGTGGLAPNATPATQPALFGAYHHILTHPTGGGGGSGGGGGTAPAPTPTPARHRVALALLAQLHARPRWAAPDSLYAVDAGAAGPCAPRGAGVEPVFAVRLGRDGRDVVGDDDGGSLDAGKEGAKGGGGKDAGGKEGAGGAGGGGGGGAKAKTPVFPGPAPRPVLGREGAAFAPSAQGSRVPELARAVLPTNVYTRTARLVPPPPLVRGTQKLYYGPGVPAPWNGSSSAAAAAASVPTTTAAAGPGEKKERTEDGEKKGPATPGGAVAAAVSIPDATLYATWEYEVKRASDTLVLPAGSVSVGGGGRRRRG